MHVVTSYPDGLFSWVDLTTSDVEGAKAFYSGLFGWEVDERPTDTGSIYTMMQIDGKNVAGLGPMGPDMQAQGMPPMWTSYVKHDDVDAVVGKAAAAGGTVMMPPMDVMQEGRMALIVDPTGAVFGVWQPKNHIGAQLVNYPNTLVWNELQTRDSDAAKAFYKAVFGWSDSADPNGYVMFANEGRIQAGMITMDDSWGPVPPSWSVYFAVDDVEAAAAQVQALGGQVHVPPTDAGDAGRFAVVSDPQGGVFTVMQMKMVDLPPGAEA
jgi:predicted enzyme related to lactoylglutathione lyase